MPYGYPTGREMVAKVIDDLRSHSTPLFQILTRPANDRHVGIEDFRDRMSDAAPPSIDAFAEKRTEFDYIARLCIAYELLQCEVPLPLAEFVDGGGWYHHLLELIAYQDHAPPVNGRLRIVTFNYDRSLEFFLTRAFRSLYDESEDEAMTRLASIPIHHLYGSVVTDDPRKHSKPYEPEGSADAVTMAASGIALMQEARGDSTEMQAAWGAISISTQVCFLGFGFHATNFSRLFDQLDDHGRSARYLSSSVGLGDVDHQRIQRDLGSRVDFAGGAGGCLETLQEFEVLK